MSYEILFGMDCVYVISTKQQIILSIIQMVLVDY